MLIFNVFSINQSSDTSYSGIILFLIFELFGCCHVSVHKSTTKRGSKGGDGGMAPRWQYSVSQNLCSEICRMK